MSIADTEIFESPDQLQIRKAKAILSKHLLGPLGSELRSVLEQRRIAVEAHKQAATAQTNFNESLRRYEGARRNLAVVSWRKRGLHYCSKGNHLVPLNEEIRMMVYQAKSRSVSQFRSSLELMCPSCRDACIFGPDLPTGEIGVPYGESGWIQIIWPIEERSGTIYMKTRTGEWVPTHLPRPKSTPYNLNSFLDSNVDNVPPELEHGWGNIELKLEKTAIPEEVF